MKVLNENVGKNIIKKLNESYANSSDKIEEWLNSFKGDKYTISDAFTKELSKYTQLPLRSGSGYTIETINGNARLYGYGGFSTRWEDIVSYTFSNNKNFIIYAEITVMTDTFDGVYIGLDWGYPGKPKTKEKIEAQIKGPFIDIYYSGLKTFSEVANKMEELYNKFLDY